MSFQISSECRVKHHDFVVELGLNFEVLIWVESGVTGQNSQWLIAQPMKMLNTPETLSQGSKYFQFQTSVTLALDWHQLWGFEGLPASWSWTCSRYSKECCYIGRASKISFNFTWQALCHLLSLRENSNWKNSFILFTKIVIYTNKVIQSQCEPLWFYQKK